MSELLAFTAAALEGYRKTLVWQSRDEDDRPIPADIEWSQAALDEAREDVTAFVESEWEDVNGMYEGQVGSDFCLTRNGHGTGFWDRGMGERGDRLTAAAKPYGTQDGYVGDDGLLYLHS